MATMMKEKRRDKKKCKTKNVETAKTINEKIYEEGKEKSSIIGDENVSHSNSLTILREPTSQLSNVISGVELLSTTYDENNVSSTREIIEKTNTPSVRNVVSEERQVFLQSEPTTHCIINSTTSEADLKPCTSQDVKYAEEKVLTDAVILPSAPVLEESEHIHYVNENLYRVVVKEHDAITRVDSMNLEDAINLYAGKEIAEVKVMSEKEEAIVEAGPQSDSDHPLIDLLSTFRTSLIAVEREQNRICCGYVEEEKSRATLWLVEKRNLNLTEKCPCGSNVTVRVTFDVARLQTEKLPAARLRLESLLRDVQESYCHHQHSALQAHYCVDELLAEILQNGKDSIREALLLVLQALRLCDGAPEAYAQALQRWAAILSHRLLDDDDLRQLLFLLHCLFRQRRSVEWAARAVRLRAGDARLLALLQLLLRPAPAPAEECTEAIVSSESEAWEELDTRGEGGAVGEGRFRERDLMALLDALSIHHLLAKLALFEKHDLGLEEERSWGDRGGGRRVLRACCGVRALLSVLRAGGAAHRAYRRLRARLADAAAAALHALAALHLHCQSSYIPEFEGRVAAELEACFAGGLEVLEEEAHRLPAELLGARAAVQYCTALLGGLHDRAVLVVPALGVSAPRLPCGAALRAAASAARARPRDAPLAGLVLDALVQIAFERGAQCAGGCGAAARELLPALLGAHPRLHAALLRRLPDLCRAEAVDPSSLQPLSREQWRPTPAEVSSVLREWGARCPLLLRHLLLHMDYTPHTGVSLDSQLAVGAWLCEWVRSVGEAPEWAWEALQQLRVHRALWGLPLDAPSPERPPDLFSTAYALMASDWGHCVPLVCGPGAEALCALAKARPADAARVAGPLVRVMALAPESIALTPRFEEAFLSILSAGPSLLRRALGRREPGADDALERVVMGHLQEDSAPAQRSAALCAWLHALWRPALPAAARRTLDRAVRLTRDWRTLDAHVALLLREPDAKEYASDAVRHAAVAPLLCEAVLRALHAAELHSQLHARLLDELVRQRAAAQRIHVDNALKQIGSPLVDTELAIHRSAAAALQAPPQHPAHLLLWRLLLHTFLQRPPSAPSESTPPVGPLFFSGMVKSRTLTALKKRLQETAAYHRVQADALGTKDETVTAHEPVPEERDSTPTDADTLFSDLTIKDLVEESEVESESSDEERGADDTKGASEATAGRDRRLLLSYHKEAERLVCEYLSWLERGESARAGPHRADVALFISEQALEAAWRHSLEDTTSPPPSPSGRPTPPPPASPPPHQTHFERAVEAILSVKSQSSNRYKAPRLPRVVDEKYFTDVRLLTEMVQRNFRELEQIGREWEAEARRVRALDERLWALVGALRVRRPLPPVCRACPQRCHPVELRVPEDEWCMSSGAEQEIQENRRSARSAVRRLARARPPAARRTARVLAVGRRALSRLAALSVADAAFAAAAGALPYPPAYAALCELVSALAAKYLSVDVQLTTEYLCRWSGRRAARELCPLLVRPRLLRARDRPRLYRCVLGLPLPPHVAFAYLSKFDVASWADALQPAERAALLRAAVGAAAALGAEPDPQQAVLLELLAVHVGAAARADAVCALVLQCAQACAAGTLPPMLLEPLPALVDAHGEALDFDQLGHLVRELGVVWWACRAQPRARAPFALYAPHWADVLHAALGRLARAALRRTYGPERVVSCAWSALLESWAAWVVPHSAPPLLRCAGDAYSDAVARFRRTALSIADGCPGGEDVLLRRAFEWAVRTYLAIEPHWPQDGRIQMSALLAELSSLPWQRQWFHAELLPLLVQVSRSPERELTSWCGARLRHLQAHAWTRGVADRQLAPALAALLDALLSKELPLPEQTLEEACALPWARLPEPAAESALDRYFCDHFSPARPYHDAPQFKLALAVGGLSPASGAWAWAGAGERRARAVSRWVRAAAAPALLPHVPAHCRRVLDVITALAPHSDPSSGELEYLLGRAAALLCAEPGATVALPVWLSWAASCPPRLVRACASAAGAVTALDHFAALADRVAKTILAEKEGPGWAELERRWAGCAQAEAGALCARGALHAAYGALRARAHDDDALRRTFAALLATDVNFAEDEAMAGVWICAAGRAALRLRRAGAAGGPGAAAARALLAGWAERRRSLLQVVTLHSADRCPTPHLRALCRLALRLAWPAEEAGPSPVAAPCRPPRPSQLPQLAATLFPRHQVYFEDELRLADDAAYEDT